MSRLSEPTQWPRIWTSLAPVARQTASTPAGQSYLTMSSTVKERVELGKAGLAR